jgi:hypothetical protein
MCDSTLGETMDHPLVSCKMASDLHVSNTSGISTPGSTNADSVRTSWGRGVNKKIKTDGRQSPERYGKNATDTSSKAKGKTYMLLK